MTGYLTKNSKVLWVAGKNFTYKGKSYTVGDEIDEIKLFPRCEVFVRTRHVIPIVEVVADAPFEFRHEVMTRARASQKLGVTVAGPAQVGTYVPGDHTIPQVLAYVDQHPDDQSVQVIYDAELAAGARTTLLDGLEARGAVTPAPVASFTRSPTSGPTPLAVTFTNTSTGRHLTYVWNFGDSSSTVTTTSPSHTFTGAATRTVTLTATNTTGSNAITHTVTVSP